MKENKLYKFLFFIAVGMIAGFSYQIAMDYTAYGEAVTSAPFTAILLKRAGQYLIPSAVAFAAAMLVKGKK